MSMQNMNAKPFVEVVAESLGNDVIEIRSTSNPNKTYKVDVVNGRCSCPAWIFQRGGSRQPCKHLKQMGFGALKSTVGMK